jgi:hypothetical protein
MANSFSNLKFEILEVGGNDGTWGPIVNTNVGTAIEQAITGMATLLTADFTANVATLVDANTNAAQNFRAFCLNITATLSAAGTVNVPAIQKPYLVLNNSVGGFAVTVKVSGQTGVSIPNGKACLVYNTGTDVGAAITHLTSLTLATALPVLSGGTGATTASGARSNLSAAVSGANSDITSLTGLTTPLSVAQALLHHLLLRELIFPLQALGLTKQLSIHLLHNHIQAQELLILPALLGAQATLHQVAVR